MNTDKRAIYVYNGDGSSKESVDMLCMALSKHCPRYNVNTITPEQIKQGVLLKTCALLAIGGGRDMGYINALGTEGMRIIKEYVQNGGSYFGICAGAYFACQRIEFDKGGKLEVIGLRDLGFFPGTCIGPTFPGFVYDCEAGAHATELIMADQASDAEGSEGKTTVTAYYNGGGHFILDRNADLKNVKTIARYAAATGGCQEDAIVECYFGSGVAILSGAHVEFMPDKMNINDPFITPIIQRLQQTADSRNNFFSSLLKELKISDVFE